MMTQPIDSLKYKLEMFVRRAVRREANCVFAYAYYVVDLRTWVKVFEALGRKQGTNLRHTIGEQVRRGLLGTLEERVSSDGNITCLDDLQEAVALWMYIVGDF
jgi:hypothetical protein